VILTKILHVELWPSPKCAPDGLVQYGNPTFKLFDAGQHLKQTQQSLDGIYKFSGPPAGRAAAAAAANPSSPESMFLWEFRVSESEDAAGPQFVALVTADGRRYTFVTPRRPSGGGGGGGGWGPVEAPRLLLAAIEKPLPGPDALPGRASAPSGDMYLYRVGAPVTGLPQSQRCRGDGTPPPQTARKAGEWQFWVYEKPSCFLAWCRGVWTDERLCENGPNSLRAA
jgi:hypothetical protein